MGSSDLLTVVFVIGLLGFLVMRGIVCWYFKLTDIVDLLKSIVNKIGEQK